MKKFALLFLLLTLQVALGDLAVTVNPTSKALTQPPASTFYAANPPPGGAPTGTASGNLGGNYPSPTVVSGSHLTGGTFNFTALNAYDTPENHGGIADGKRIADVSSTSGNATITSASANFTSADVGKAVQLYSGKYIQVSSCVLTSGSPTVTTASTANILAGDAVGGLGVQAGATVSSVTNGTTFVLSANATLNRTNTLGFYPPYIVTTISSVTNSATAVLAANAAYTGSNVVMIYGTDNTSALQAAINAVNTAGGGAVKLLKGLYLFAGALQNTSTNNSVITLPFVSYLVSPTVPINSILIEGTGYVGNGASQDFSNPAPVTGSVLYCITQGTGTNPSFFSCDPSTAMTGSNISSNNIGFKNVTVRCPPNPTLNAIKTVCEGGVYFNNFTLDVYYGSFASVMPCSTAVTGLVLPNFNNGAKVELHNIEVDNWPTGVQASYHAYITSAAFQNNGTAISVCNSTVHGNMLHFIQNFYNFAPGPSITAPATLDFRGCEFEDSVNTIWTIQNDILDGSGNNFNGLVEGTFSQGGGAPTGFTSGYLTVIADNGTTAFPTGNVYNPKAITTGTTTQVYIVPSSGAGGISFDNSSGTQDGSLLINDTNNTTILQNNKTGGTTELLSATSNGLKVSGTAAEFLPSTTVKVDVATASTMAGFDSTNHLVSKTENVDYAGATVMTANTTGTISFNTANHNETIYNTSASTLATATITLPASSVAGQSLCYVTNGAITTLTMSGTVDIGTSPTSAAATNCFIWQCDIAGHWVRKQ